MKFWWMTSLRKTAMWLKVRENLTHIGVVSYSTHIRVDLTLGEYFEKSDVLSVIWAIDYMEADRNTADAIDEMRNMFNE